MMCWPEVMIRNLQIHTLYSHLPHGLSCRPSLIDSLKYQVRLPRTNPKLMYKQCNENRTVGITIIHYVYFL